MLLDTQTLYEGSVDGDALGLDEVYTLSLSTEALNTERVPRGQNVNAWVILTVEK